MLGWDTPGDTPRIHVNFGNSREKPKCYLNQQVTLYSWTCIHLLDKYCTLTKSLTFFKIKCCFSCCCYHHLDFIFQRREAVELSLMSIFLSDLLCQISFIQWFINWHRTSWLEAMPLKFSLYLFLRLFLFPQINNPKYLIVSIFLA